MVLFGIVDLNSLTRGSINQLDFEILIPLAVGENPWYRMQVENKVKFEFKMSILRYFKQRIWRSVFKFKRDITDAVAKDLRREKLFSNHDIHFYFIDLNGKKRLICFETFLYNLSIHNNQVSSLVMVLKPVSPSFINKTLVISTTAATMTVELNQNKKAIDTKKNKQR